jgi:hypothetical protein
MEAYAGGKASSQLLVAGRLSCMLQAIILLLRTDERVSTIALVIRNFRNFHCTVLNSFARRSKHQRRLSLAVRAQNSLKVLVPQTLLE